MLKCTFHSIGTWPKYAPMLQERHWMTGVETVETPPWNVFSTFRGTHFPPRGAWPRYRPMGGTTTLRTPFSMGQVQKD
jgi:hypothetical protein